MQIDFHYGTTYVLARLAGFNADDSYVIAYSSQYVDDSNTTGEIHFRNQPYASYYRIRTAHRYSNLISSIVTVASEDYNNHTWVPFHFLPGYCGLAAGEPCEETNFVDHLVCVRNSAPAQGMLEECLRRRSDKNALHRLGLTMHVYADTWSHHGFAGINNEINEVEDLSAEGAGLDSKVSIVQNVGDDVLPPLGHMRAFSYPDLGFVTGWRYRNGGNQWVERHNLSEFMDAAEHMKYYMYKFRLNRKTKRIFLPSDRDQLEILLQGTYSHNASERLGVWMDAIRTGKFSFGADKIPDYVAQSIGSWKYDAVGEVFSGAMDITVDNFHAGFLDSNWRNFHDAAQAHRFFILYVLLPQYGILCCSRPR